MLRKRISKLGCHFKASAETILQKLLIYFFFRLKAQQGTATSLRDPLDTDANENDPDGVVLDYGARGRPVRLGRYDAVVRAAIKKLLGEGEKVSSFLCIAVAKQVGRKRSKRLYIFCEKEMTELRLYKVCRIQVNDSAQPFLLLYLSLRRTVGHCHLS